ncbi:DUF4011 domain-containing protein [Akkermansiaceae bacterium]|nr:DUF4011 domain-containing protein [Akkermansiaceae bacterium]
MSDNTNIDLSGDDKRVARAIEALREDLLDLSRRNSLINAKYNSGKKYIRIVDELPSQICKHLLNQKEFRFDSVPDPSDEEIEQWRADNSRDDGKPSAKDVAGWFNIIIDSNLANASREGVGNRHTDNSLQTPYFSKELESRLSTIKRSADSQVQETGVNMLYLTIGYLEWFESEDSNKPFLSPLFSIPVTLLKGELDKQTKTYIYTIQWSGEDLVANASLAKRLERDFGFVLPEISTSDEGDVIDIEKYLAVVKESIQEAHPSWSIQRRGILSFLNFSKLLMYNDLDVQKWPGIVKHSLVRATIVGSGNENNTSDNYLDDREIDEIENIEMDYPLVESADSSQYSAIIDALNGNSMIIEGPPGTGKSQTITNLIVAFLHKGKSVLFVSEKMAALSVVKDRLTKLGLDDFVLELHSHATKKLGVIESFDKRLKRRSSRSSGQLNQEIDNITRLRDKLNDHARLMNTEWGGTGVTIFEALTAVIKEKKILDGDLRRVAERLCIGGCETAFDREEIYRKTDSLLRSSQKQLVACTNNKINTHPWHGINAADLTGADRSQVIELLKDWRKSLIKLRESLETLKDISNSDSISEPSSGNSVAELVKELPPIGNTSLQFLAWGLPDSAIHERLAEFNRLAAGIAKLLEASVYNLTTDQLDNVPLYDCTELARLSDELNVNRDIPLSEFGDVQSCIESMLQASENIRGRLAEYESFCEKPLPEELMQDNLTALSVADFISSYDWILELKEAIDCRHPSFLTEDGLSKLSVMQEGLSRLNEAEESMSESYILKDIPSIAEIDDFQQAILAAGLIGKLMGKDYRHAKSRIRGLYRKDSKSFKAEPLHDHLLNLRNYATLKIEFTAAYDQLDQGVKSLLKPDSLSPSLIEFIKRWHSKLREDYSVESVGLFSEFRLNSIGDWIMIASKRELLALEKFPEHRFGDSLEQLQAHYVKLNYLCVAGVSLVNDASPLGDLSNLSEVNALRSFDSEIKSLEKHPLYNERFSLLSLLTEMQRIHSAKNKYKHLQEQIDSLAVEVGLSEVPSDAAGVQEFCWAVQQVVAVIDAIRESDEHVSEIVRAAVVNNTDFEEFKKFLKWAEEYDAVANDAAQAKSAFVEKVALAENNWHNSISRDINASIERCDKALKNEEEFSSYVLFLQSKAELRESVDPEFVECITSGQYTPDSIRSATRLGVMQKYAVKIFQENPSLSNFQGTDHEGYVKAFNESTDKLRSLQLKSIVSSVGNRSVPNGNVGYRVSEKTERHLIKHECNKQRRHIPIRQLLQRAPVAAQALKPCFMMGPRSVAQYLTPNTLEFDVLLIDEASQLKPAEALGACARSSQIVVVGDSKQLPPTSFFDRLSDDDDDDAISMSDNESILDAVKGADFPSRILRWHYRSRHESLIDFSNIKFYNNELKLFPSPQKNSTTYGITYHYIEEGLFENQQNKNEALSVANRVKYLISRNPDRSIGVVAMSRKQADLVNGYIEQLAKGDSQFREALKDNEEKREKLWVKNLETVQGDERDVIIISFTYGCGKHAPTPQRFPLINQEMGWRRLNVLFTRSRERMEVFASMHHGDVRPTPSSSRGVWALKDFLHYAETGHLQRPEITGRPPDSDFEVAVANILRDNGYECDYQVGVSGFYIDLAVRHPNNPERHIMGIECDGATYHSAKSARDRDYLRQSILEDLGWKIRRVWSTDWFNNHQQCIAPIIQELNSLSNDPVVADNSDDCEPASESSAEEQLTEEIAYDDLELFSDEYVDDDAEDDLGEGVKIEIHDTVTVQFDDDEVETYTIVYGSTFQSNNKLNYESCLAQALLDKVVHPQNPTPISFRESNVTVLNVEKPSLGDDDEMVAETLESEEVTSEVVAAGEVTPSESYYALIDYYYSINENSEIIESHYGLYSASKWNGLAELVKDEVVPIADRVFSSWHRLPHLSADVINEYHSEFEVELDEILEAGKNMMAEQFLELRHLGEEGGFGINIVACGDSKSFQKSLIKSIDNNDSEVLSDYLVDDDYADMFLHFIPDNIEDDEYMPENGGIKNHLIECKRHRKIYSEFKEAKLDEIREEAFMNFISEAIKEAENGEKLYRS